MRAPFLGVENLFGRLRRVGPCVVDARPSAAPPERVDEQHAVDVRRDEGALERRRGARRRTGVHPFAEPRDELRVGCVEGRRARMLRGRCQVEGHARRLPLGECRDCALPVVLSRDERRLLPEVPVLILECVDDLVRQRLGRVFLVEVVREVHRPVGRLVVARELPLEQRVRGLFVVLPRGEETEELLHEPLRTDGRGGNLAGDVLPHEREEPLPVHPDARDCASRGEPADRARAGERRVEERVARRPRGSRRVRGDRRLRGCEGPWLMKWRGRAPERQADGDGDRGREPHGAQARALAASASARSPAIAAR